MALTFESGRILEELNVLRERSFLSQGVGNTKDAFSEQLYSQSPVNFDVFFLALEMEEDADVRNRPSRKNSLLAEKKVEDENAKKERNTKVKVFELPEDAKKFKFVKETISNVTSTTSSTASSTASSTTPVVSVTSQPYSNLTAMVLSMARNGSSSGGADGFRSQNRGVNSMVNIGGVGTEAKLLLKIFLPLPSTSSSSKHIKIRVGVKTSVDQVIQEAVKGMLDLESKEADINKALESNHMPHDPKAYILRVAEDDGTPDDDVPNLVRNQEVGQFKGCVVFALCRDPKFKEEQEQEQPKVTPTSIAALRLFKVFFPQFRNSYVSLIYKENMTLKEVREFVCNKRQLPPDQFSFQHCDTVSSTAFLPIDMLLKDIPKEDRDQLNLVDRKQKLGSLRRKGSMKSLLDLQHYYYGNNNSNTSNNSNNNNTSSESDNNDAKGTNTDGNDGNAIGDSEEREKEKDKDEDYVEKGDASAQIFKKLGAIFFLTPSSATKYQQYTVIKGNKFGAKQERIMGIDAERITNSIPDKKGTAAKKPVRFMKDVVKAALIPNKPRFFLIEFKDKTYKYEANQAEEIIAKINYLIDMGRASKTSSSELEQ